MELWEKRYLHAKACRDTQLEVLGLPIPQDEKYGTIERVSKDLYRTFDGSKFFPILNSKGHTSAVFESCSCYNK